MSDPTTHPLRTWEVLGQNHHEWWKGSMFLSAGRVLVQSNRRVRDEYRGRLQNRSITSEKL